PRVESRSWDEKAGGAKPALRDAGGPMRIPCLALALVLAACNATVGSTNNGDTTAGNGGAAGASGCTYTQGYWKNHAKAWPVQSLTIGGVMYTQAQLLVIFDTAPAGDASLVLAH